MAMAANNLNDLLQERFTDHEVGVDPGVWQAISGQLVAAAPAADGLSDLLKDRFQQHEAQVDPGTWGQISSQLGHGAAAGAAGGSGLGGWMAAGIAATLLTGGILFWAATPDAPTQNTASLAPASTAAPAENKATEVVPPTTAPLPNGTVDPLPTRSLASQEPGTPTSGANTPPTEPTIITPNSPADQRNGEPPPPPPIKEGEHMPEVEMIIDRLIQQTNAAPEIAQTESIPEVGLVQGHVDVPEEGNDGPEDPLPPSPTAAPLVWIPNAFSPGMRDGVNDELEVRAEGLSDVRVRIYSLSNQLVFSATDLRAWDGRDMSGQLCAEDYYFYAIEGVDGNGKPYSKGQTVRLFR
jgi:hypothetical protein